MGKIRTLPCGVLTLGPRYLPLPLGSEKGQQAWDSYLLCSKAHIFTYWFSKEQNSVSFQWGTQGPHSFLQHLVITLHQHWTRGEEHKGQMAKNSHDLSPNEACSLMNKWQHNHRQNSKWKEKIHDLVRVCNRYDLGARQECPEKLLGER